MANIALVTVEGDLDVRTVPALRRRIDRLVSDGCRRIFLNMAGARYVDSAGMGLILTELRRMRGAGGLLSLMNVSPQAYQALRRMRVFDYMPVSRAGERRAGLPCRIVKLHKTERDILSAPGQPCRLQ